LLLSLTLRFIFLRQHLPLSFLSFSMLVIPLFPPLPESDPHPSTIGSLPHSFLASSLPTHLPGQDSTWSNRLLYFQLIFARDLFIALMMEAVRTYEMSVYFNEATRRYVSESCHLHTLRRENLNSHFLLLYFHNSRSSVYGLRGAIKVQNLNEI
jgi:hypothetical protein